MELQKIIRPRIPPYLWDILGYISGFITIFSYNRTGIILFGCLFFIYKLSNIFFDICVVSFEYSNDLMPIYTKISWQYNQFITDKKYILQNKPISIFDHESQELIPIKKVYVDNSKLKIELSIYIGENNNVKNLLFFMYIIGITKKNYTMLEYDNFKDNIVGVRFV